MLLDQWSLLEANAEFVPPPPGNALPPRRPVFSEIHRPSYGKTTHRLALRSAAVALIADGVTTLPLVSNVVAQSLTAARHSALRSLQAATATPVTTTRHKATQTTAEHRSTVRSPFDASRAVAAALSAHDDEAIIALLVAARSR